MLSREAVEALVSFAGHAPPTSACDAATVQAAVAEGISEVKARIDELTDKLKEQEDALGTLRADKEDLETEVADLKLERDKFSAEAQQHWRC